MGEYERRQKEAYQEYYLHLRKEIHNPPPGWFRYGSHAYDEDIPWDLEFWGTDVDLLPIWERPKE